MKANLQILVSMLWCLTTSHACVINFTAGKRARSHPNLHSQYTDLLNGNVVQLLVEGYEGEVQYHTINTTFVPSYHYTNTKYLVVGDFDLVERADVCLRLTDCAGLLKDFVAFYAIQGLNGFVNNYAHATAVLDGVVASLAILVPGTIAAYYINAQFDTLKGSSTQDACGETQPAVMAENAASAMYEFCVGLQTTAMADVTTRFDVSDATANDDTFVSNDGIRGLSKFNIGSVEFDTLAVCSDYGITWRRDLASVLLRGKQRSTKRVE